MEERRKNLLCLQACDDLFNFRTHFAGVLGGPRFGG